MNLYRYTVFKGADPDNLIAFMQIQIRKAEQ